MFPIPLEPICIHGTKTHYKQTFHGSLCQEGFLSKAGITNMLKAKVLLKLSQEITTRVEKKYKLKQYSEASH